MPPEVVHDERLTRRAAAVLLAAIVVAGATCRIVGLGFGLPHTQARPDETFLIGLALGFLQGDFLPRFYFYPWLYGYVLALVYLLDFAWQALAGRVSSLAAFVAGFPLAWQPFFLLDRAVSATCGTATILIVYGIARRLSGRTAGVVAAFLLSLAFLHVRDSHFGTTDAAMTLLVACSIRALLDSASRRSGRSDVMAAVWAGLAVGVKYNAGLLVVPLAIGHLLRALAEPSSRLRAMFDRRAMVIAASFAVVFVAGAPFLLLAFNSFRADLGPILANVRGGHGPHLPPANGWWYYLTVSLRYGVGAPILILGLVGMAVAAGRDWRKALLVFSFPIVYFASAGSMENVFLRYAVPLVPFVCIGAAVAMDAAANVVPAGRRGLREVIVAVVAVVAVIPSAASVVSFDRLLAQTDNRVVVADWMLRHARPGESVMQSGSISGYAQFDRRARLNEWVWRGGTFVVGRSGPAAGRPDWILLQESPIPSATQPEVTELLKTGYQLAAVFPAYDPRATGNLYDLQDRFYLPFAGFNGIERPGPNFYVYRKVM